MVGLSVGQRLQLEFGSGRQSLGFDLVAPEHAWLQNEELIPIHTKAKDGSPDRNRHVLARVEVDEEEPIVRALATPHDDGPFQSRIHRERPFELSCFPRRWHQVAPGSGLDVDGVDASRVRDDQPLPDTIEGERPVRCI